MKVLHIMRGLPGSGKSTLAQDLRYIHSPYCAKYSTDDYWMRPDGVYDFNYDLVAKAHKWNIGRVEKGMKCFIRHIIVDNVNTTYQEIRPYAMLAKEYEYAIQLVEATTAWAMNVEECFKRNTHGVPYATILRMYNSWETASVIYGKLKRLGVKVHETKQRKS